MSGEKNYAPRLREQYKDNAVEVEKNVETARELKVKQLQQKEAEIRDSPKEGI